jgi:hypothetical protein
LVVVPILLHLVLFVMQFGDLRIVQAFLIKRMPAVWLAQLEKFWFFDVFEENPINGNGSLF